MDGIEPYKEKMVKDRDEIDEHFSLPYQLLHTFGDATYLDIHEDMKVNTPYYSLDKDKVVIPDHHRYKLSDAFFIRRKNSSFSCIVRRCCWLLKSAVRTKYVD